MPKRLKNFCLGIMAAGCLLTNNLAGAQIDVSPATMQFLSAWTSLAVYDDKYGQMSRKVMCNNGWQIKIYNEKIDKSDVKYLVADKSDDGEDIYILAVSGTSSWTDVKTNLKVNSAVFKGNDIKSFAKYMADEELTDDKSLVHKGFLTYVQDGFFTPNSHGKVVGMELAEQLKADPRDKIYLTGHSLGGAVAELLAARLVDLGVAPDQIRVITFGAPAVGNLAFVENYEPKINLTRITLAGDVVKNLSQIANDRFVQFQGNEEWKVDRLDDDKFAHSILLYFDQAIRNYYDSSGAALHQEMQSKESCDYYVAKINYDFPKELKKETAYINDALEDEFLKSGGNYYLSDKRESYREVFANARKMHAKYVIFYNFSADKLRDTRSHKRYYLSGSKYVYDIQGNLVGGYSANADTKEMTLLQSALYLDYQFNNCQGSPEPFKCKAAENK